MNRPVVPSALLPPHASLRWAAASVGRSAKVVSVRPLAGGRSHANHLLVVELPSGTISRVVLRRWVRPEWKIDDPDFTVEREAEVLRRCEQAGVPAPRVIAADANARDTDVPALLETVVPGRRIVNPADLDTFARRLAEPLAVIRAVPTDAARDLVAIPYRRFFDPARTMPPAWGRDASVWAAAIAVACRPMPDAAWGLIHRDYHPGNVLWSRGHVSGIVDWTMGSFGPYPIDLGHMRFNLAASYGLPVADAVLDECVRLDLAQDYSPEWDIRTTLDVVPDIDPRNEPRSELQRIENHIAAALSKLG